MSKTQFLSASVLPDVQVEGQRISAKPMQYSTGSVGYNLNGKITLANGVRMQVSGNAVVIGSKEWSA